MDGRGVAFSMLNGFNPLDLRPVSIISGTARSKTPPPRPFFCVPLLGVTKLCHRRKTRVAGGLHAAILAKTDGVCSYQCGVPDELVDTWKKKRDFPQGEEWRDRRVQQRADAPTKAFVEYLRSRRAEASALYPLRCVAMRTHARFNTETQRRRGPDGALQGCPG